MVPPANTPGAMSGNVILKNLRPAGGAEVFGGFLHGGVDVGEGGGDIQVQDRVEVQGVERDDAPEAVLPEPVDGPVRREEMEVVQEGVDAALLAEDFFDADGPDERRQDHRREQQRGERLFSRELVVVAQPGERHRQGERRERAGDGEEEGVTQPLDVHRVAENLGDISKCEIVPDEERHAQGLHDGINEEHGEERGGQRVDEGGKGAGHGGGIITERGSRRQAASRRR